MVTHAACYIFNKFPGDFWERGKSKHCLLKLGEKDPLNLKKEENCESLILTGCLLLLLFCCCHYSWFVVCLFFPQGPDAFLSIKQLTDH